MYIITDSKDTVRVHALTLYMYMAACMGRRAPIMLLPPARMQSSANLEAVNSSW